MTGTESGNNNNYDVVISEFMDPAAVEQLAAKFHVHYDPGLVDQPAQLISYSSHCRALIVRNRTQVRGELLAACQHLQVVGRLGVGLDNIDVAACQQRNIQVIPATGANTVSVAEYVVAALLLLLRGAYSSSQAVANGEWPRQQLIGREAYQRQLGLIGCGAIARAVASRAQALAMQVAAYDPLLTADDAIWQQINRYTDLDILLRDSDVISLHIPLTEQTKHLIDATTLHKMKPGAILINTARGGIVDETALAQSLHDGHLSGAALDVFAAEPLAAHSVLAAVPNLLLTPHIAGVTEESNVRVSELIANQVRQALLNTT